MIEYLNAISTVLLLIISVVSLARAKHLRSDKIWKGVEYYQEKREILKDIFQFIGSLPKWLDYYNDLNANEQLLQEKGGKLMRRMKDIKDRVEYEEFRMGKSRTHEVDNWLSSVVNLDTRIQEIFEQISRETSNFSKFLYRAWLGRLVEKRIQEVEYLLGLGVFDRVLCNAREAIELRAVTLVGGGAISNKNMIMEWLRDGVTMIGVHGIKGIGKTAIMKVIHNELLTGDLHVYMIQLPENFEYDSQSRIESELQSRIANQLDLKLQEEDELRKAAVLHRALKGRRFVLILDGLTRYFSLENVGIPLDSTQGKMVVTSRSPVVCRRMGCLLDRTLRIDPLPTDDALELFKKNVAPHSHLKPELEDVALNIVEQCQGVPLRILESAVSLRGEDDISVWKEKLGEMSTYNA